MAEFKLPQHLKNLPARLKQLSFVFTILIAVVPPLGYWTLSYEQEMDRLSYSASQAADAVSELVFMFPNEWDLQYPRIAYVIDAFRPSNYEANIYVYDKHDTELLSDDLKHFLLSVDKSSAIKSNNEVVGTVEVEASLLPLILETLYVVVFSLVVALGFIVMISRYSISGIKSAVFEIDRINSELHEQGAYLNSILSSTQNIAIIATDKDWGVRYYNKTAERLFGQSRQGVQGLPLREVYPELWGNIRTAQRVGLPDNRKEVTEFVLSVPVYGKERRIKVQLYRIIQAGSGITGNTILCSDVTSEHEAAELIEHQATYDSLTDLPNRRLFLDQLDNALARAQRHFHVGAVLFLDLDNFKNINDSLGHAVGDLLLQEVAKRLVSALREEDVIARLGGDEFVVLLPEIPHHSDETINLIRELAEKVRKKISSPYAIEQHTLHISTSIGISVFPGEVGNGAGDIMKQADTAMYRAKESGRNTFKFFLPSMQRTAESRLKTLSDLRHGIEHGEFLVFYQPQYDANRDLVGAEALIRWQHPERGLVPPDDFIPLAEESGLILELGRCVLETALTNLHRWVVKKYVTSSFRLSVNISPQQFMQHKFVQSVEYALGNSGADSANLTLEITEDVLLDNVKTAINIILELKNSGIHFSIDDFGTGYSSLAYLKRLSNDEVKIDRSFVRDVLENDSGAALVEAIIGLTTRLGLDSVAEGVETQDQFEYLKKLGCTRYQGFLFSKPLPESEFENYINSHKQVGNSVL